MAETLTAHQKKIVALDRLYDGEDRIVRQRPQTNFPDSAWMMKPPQWHLSISVVRWMERHGLIAESIAPAPGQHPRRPTEAMDDMRRYYQRELGHRVYAITEKGRKWYLAA